MLYMLYFITFLIRYSSLRSISLSFSFYLSHVETYISIYSYTSLMSLNVFDPPVLIRVPICIIRICMLNAHISLSLSPLSSHITVFLFLDSFMLNYLLLRLWLPHFGAYSCAESTVLHAICLYKRIFAIH